MTGYVVRTLAIAARLNNSGAPSGLPFTNWFAFHTPHRKRFFPAFVTRLTFVQT